LGLEGEIVLRRIRTAVLFAAAWVVGAGVAAAGASPQLRYVVIISRHGVRSPLWTAERLNEYSAEPWPQWGVPPGNLTPHGRALMQLMGAYYREWLSSEHLLRQRGCEDAGRIYIYADTDQRTLETAHALAESLLPGCDLSVHSQPDHEKDPLFVGTGTPDRELVARAARERLGPHPERLITDHASALATLQFILTDGKSAARKLSESAPGVSHGGNPAAGAGLIATASTLSEALMLEYTNGMLGTDLGWGRLTKENLFNVLELHRVHADLAWRVPYLARAKGSNLLAHVLRSMEEAVSGAPVPGALGHPGDALLVLSGHDTNLAHISSMLGLSWRLPGYQPDDTPPGGALVFSLWRDSGGEYSVKTEYLAQTLDQMRNGDPLTVAAPPASEELLIPGCGVALQFACAWGSFKLAVEEAIDPAFTALGAETRGPAVQ
jgi:4-phytase/acid phosphatase